MQITSIQICSLNRATHPTEPNRNGGHTKSKTLCVLQIFLSSFPNDKMKRTKKNHFERNEQIQSNDLSFDSTKLKRNSTASSAFRNAKLRSRFNVARMESTFGRLRERERDCSKWQPERAFCSFNSTIWKKSPKATSRVCDQLRHNFEWTKYIELNRITVQIHTFSPAIQTNSSVNIPRSFLIKKRIAIKKNSLTLCIRHLSKC